MIIKNFELEKLQSTKIKKILFYGENEGYKNQILNNFFIKKFSENFEKYEENQILNNYEDFFSSILNKSFFVKDKLIIKKAYVDQGPTMKRFRPAAMGRAVRILKRTSYLTIIISDK